MNVPDEIRKCVVFLAYDSPNHGQVLAGTGFLLGMPDGGRHFAYLVTAAHVIEGIQEKGFRDIYVRVNTKGGAAHRVQTQYEQWSFHPTNPAVDVAALLWPTWVEQDFKVFPVSAVASPEVISREGIGVGDEVFMAGLYTKHAGAGRNLPIIRVGNVAAMPEEPCETKRGQMSAYLVEIRSIGGISGSPVFVRPFRLMVDENRGGEIVHNPRAFYLLGLMHGRWDMRHLAPVMFEIDADYLKQPLNSGIGVVVPVESILEVLNQPSFVAERQEKIKQWQEQNATSTDAVEGS